MCEELKDDLDIFSVNEEFDFQSIKKASDVGLP